MSLLGKKEAKALAICQEQKAELEREKVILEAEIVELKKTNNVVALDFKNILALQEKTKTKQKRASAAAARWRARVLRNKKKED